MPSAHPSPSKRSIAFSAAGRGRAASPPPARSSTRPTSSARCPRTSRSTYSDRPPEPSPPPVGGTGGRRGVAVSDGELISELYAGSFRRLVVQLYAVTGDLNEAQEAVQEAFTKALTAPRRFAELENPEAWLRRVAVNVARSRFRRRRVLDGLLRRIGPPPAVADHSPEHLALLAALRGLPEGQRQALALHYLVDLPVDEVAATLGVSAGTVKSRLSRGRTALAALLTDSDATDTTETGRIDARS
ncbi:sigma-70 family RNA polymerase sigma factor [Micromonospora sp. CV4]|nr:sigma-70 family RNA polymerase sigma factor [Micromonospora sp. CV4]